jgi:hypothetical protein
VLRCEIEDGECNIDDDMAIEGSAPGLTKEEMSQTLSRCLRDRRQFVDERISISAGDVITSGSSESDTELEKVVGNEM